MFVKRDLLLNNIKDYIAGYWLRIEKGRISGPPIASNTLSFVNKTGIFTF